MDADAALSNLMEVSSQVEAAVLLGPGGDVLASTLDDADRTTRLARAAHELLERARAAGPAEARVRQLEAAVAQGSVFVVRDGDRAIVATTAPSPASALVFYDLKTCLRAAADAPA